MKALTVLITMNHNAPNGALGCFKFLIYLQIFNFYTVVAFQTFSGGRESMG